jgi:hypothetical protein
MDGGQQGLEDLKQIEKYTSGELLDLTLSFNNLTESYTTEFQAIKSKLLALKQSSTSMGTNGSSCEDAGQRNIRWDNLSLHSPDASSSLEDQLTGLRTRVSDLEHGGLLTQSDHELRGLNEELKALDQKVSIRQAQLMVHPPLPSNKLMFFAATHQGYGRSWGRAWLHAE